MSEIFDKGLPANIEAEKFVLGSILLDDALFSSVAGSLDAEDFLLEKHKRIFRRMADLAERGENIEYLTVINELDKHVQLEAVDGIAYISSLTDGLPRLTSIDSYVRIVKDKSLLRQMIHTCQTVISQCVESAEETAEVLAEAETAVMKVADQQLRSGLMNPAEIVKAYPDGVEGFLNPAKRPKGLQTHWLKLDEMTTGLHKGELITLAARPAMGKTAFALNLAQTVASPTSGQTAAFFSLEMSKEQLMTRMLCSGARVDQHRFRGGYLNEDERRRLRFSANTLATSSLYIDDQADTTIAEIGAKCRRLKVEHDLHLVVVDYLQLMNGKNTDRKNRVEVVSEFSRGLKLLAKDLEVPIVALSQLSRAPEQRQGDHRPMLADLRESGSIEQDSDQVWFIFREEVYKPDREDLQGMAELIVSKQRNGPTGRVKLAFINKYTRFENLAEDVGALPYGGDDDAPFDD